MAPKSFMVWPCVVLSSGALAWLCYGIFVTNKVANHISKTFFTTTKAFLPECLQSATPWWAHPKYIGFAPYLFWIIQRALVALATKSITVFRPFSSRVVARNPFGLFMRCAPHVTNQKKSPCDRASARGTKYTVFKGSANASWEPFHWQHFRVGAAKQST